MEFHVVLIASRNCAWLLDFPQNLWTLCTGCGGGNKMNCDCVVFHDQTVSSVGSLWSQRRSVAGQTESTEIIWTPSYCTSPCWRRFDRLEAICLLPSHRGVADVDSVPVISCRGAENCLHGQLTGYMVPSCRRNRYRKGRNGYLRTMETVGDYGRSVGVRLPYYRSFTVQMTTYLPLW